MENMYGNEIEHFNGDENDQRKEKNSSVIESQTNIPPGDQKTDDYEQPNEKIPLSEEDLAGDTIYYGCQGYSHQPNRNGDPLFRGSEHLGVEPLHGVVIYHL